MKIRRYESINFISPVNLSEIKKSLPEGLSLEELKIIPVYIFEKNDFQGKLIAYKFVSEDN